MLAVALTVVACLSANATAQKTLPTPTRCAFTTSRCDMSVTVTNAKRDGDLCVATFTITTGGGNATTTENVVGHINQIGVTNSAGVSNAFTFVLEDTANGMQLFSG